MQSALTPQPTAPVSTADLWRELEEAVREACMLRAEGREGEAMQIVQGSLPALIAEWSRGAGRPAETCQQALRELFARVQQQVATAMICKRLVLRSVESPQAWAHQGSERVYIRRPVPFDDIPGMLDALEAGERSPEQRRQIFPSTALRPHLAVAAG